MKKIIRQIYEALRFAIQSVVVNKMRTLLSLLGITIGIFAIISVFTVLDAMEGSIRENMNSLGTNILYVTKWPWTPEEGVTAEYEWWKYASRPENKTSEGEELFAQLPSAKAMATVLFFNRTFKQDKRSMENSTVVAATPDYDQMRNTELSGGRYISAAEFRTGAAVAVIGATTAENLFEDQDPVGRYIKIGDTRVTVIGVFAKEGDNMFGLSYDEQLLIPYKFAGNFVNVNTMDKDIIIKGNDDVAIEEFKAEVEAAMRRIRRLPMDAPRNFTVNEVSGIMKQMDSIFAMINIVGGIIGVFSILVGGFGVANIMFVSVRERTPQIGIQKALGAKSYSILLQFTFEAVLLAVIGGAIGLLFIWGGAAVVSAVSDFSISLSVKNIAIGLGISSVIGAISGIFPAYAASRLNPVAAISRS